MTEMEKKLFSDKVGFKVFRLIDRLHFSGSCLSSLLPRFSGQKALNSLVGGKSSLINSNRDNELEDSIVVLLNCAKPHSALGQY